jgi:phosphoenolpyruvate synthase/pyruvate phosphate dikinase
MSRRKKMTETSFEFILSLVNSGATLEKVGGKGASLARLAAARLPVPDGFHITTEAYNRFVDANHLRGRIQAALLSRKRSLRHRHPQTWPARLLKPILHCPEWKHP